MANHLGNVFSGLSGLFWQMNPRQRMEMLMISILTIIVLTFVGIWAGKPTYEVLFYDMASADAGKITEKLKDIGVQYELKNNGSTILVPSSQLQDLRISLAQEGLPESGYVGYEIFDQSNLGMSSFVQKINYRRAIEGELARTLSHMDEIQSARVHLVIPEQKLFKEDEHNPSASVILKLRGSYGLTAGQVKGITKLIASAVEGLRPEYITVVDTEGKVFASGDNSDSEIVSTSERLGLQSEVEKNLTNKAQEMLASVLGSGNSITRITADLDFERIQKTRELYDPDGQVVRSEQTTTSSATGMDTTQTDREISTTKYEINRTVETVMNSVGNIKRLTVAVLVNGRYTRPDGVAVDEDVELTYEPRTDEEIANLTTIIKNAVGFDANRGDVLEVINMQFEKNNYLASVGIEESGGMFDFSTPQLIRQGAMLLIAVVLLLLLKSLTKSSGTINISQAGGRQLSSITTANSSNAIPIPALEGGPRLGDAALPEAVERTRMQAEISNYSKTHATEATALLRSWLMEN